MDVNRILVIGGSGGGRDGTFAFLPNLAEFEMIIWYPRSLREEWASWPRAQIKENMLETIRWVKQGHTLAVIDAPPKQFEITYAVNNTQYHHRPALDEPFAGITFNYTSGELVEFCGPESCRSLLEPFMVDFRYTAVLASDLLSPLLRVSRGRPGAIQAVGAYKRLGNGLAIFLPDCDADNPRSFHSSIAGLPPLLTDSAVESLAAWSANFQTSEEMALLREVYAIDDQMKRLQRELEMAEASRTQMQSTKFLFTATGEAFVKAVAEALREIGLRVIEGPSQRADLIAFDGDRVAAIEVKGLEGPTRERNVGQTRRWVADVNVALSSDNEEAAFDVEISAYRQKLAQLGVQIGEPNESKGIMIIGTHRKTPLDERGDDFPEPVMRVIARYEVCALTGLELFGLMRETKSNPEKKKEIIDSLFATNGVLARMSWRNFLTKAESA